MRSNFNNVQVGLDEALIGNSATRKILNALIAATANGAPTLATDGYDCAKWAAILLQFVSAVGTSADVKIWFYDGARQTWWLYTDFGTAGTQTVTTAASPVIAEVPTFGQSRIYIQALNFLGADNTLTATGQASAV